MNTRIPDMNVGKSIGWIVGRVLKPWFEDAARLWFMKRIRHLPPGCVVYVRFLTKRVTHTGIYTGEAMVSLSGNGVVKEESPAEFVRSWGRENTIYVGCCAENDMGDKPIIGAVGHKDVALRARSLVGENLGYKLLSNNCHSFTVGCLNGDFNKARPDGKKWLLDHVKEEAKTILGADKWRVLVSTKDLRSTIPRGRRIPPG